MEPIYALVIAGVAGGVAMAAWLFRFNRGRARNPLDTGARAHGSTDVINMASIRVEGVGGLGLVLLAIGVAAGIPQIGKSMAAGLVLGGLMAWFLIRRRRANGPMPSSGQQPGANTTLAIDADPIVVESPTPSESPVDEHDARLVIGRM